MKLPVSVWAKSVLVAAERSWAEQETGTGNRFVMRMKVSGAVILREFRHQISAKWDGCLNSHDITGDSINSPLPPKQRNHGKEETDLLK